MNVIVIGAGGMAKIVASMLIEDKNFKVSGFIDINKENQGNQLFNIPIISDHKDLNAIYESGVTCAIVAVGNNAIREKNYYELSQIGFQTINVVHPTATWSKNAKIGDGIIISKGVIIEPLVTIMNNSFIGAGAIIGLETTISENVYVGAGAIIGNGAVIQRNVRINPGCVVKPFVTVEKNTEIE